MPPKAEKPKLPDIPWTDDLIWSFLTQCEESENYKVLFGKKQTAENTSGDSKAAVFKRIAAVILPELTALDATTVARRLKGQLERLTKTYRKHAARLRRTGEGVNDEESQTSESQLSYYISGEGPDDSTPPEAVNIWQEIESEFKFFPRLHAIFASRPNVTPIVLTTALGPHGRKTIWLQPPDANGLSSSDARSSPEPPSPTPASSSSPRAFGQDITNSVPNTPTAPKLRPPKHSAAILKARSHIEKVPQKRTLLDTLVELQEKNSKMWSDEAKEKLLIQKCTHFLEEFKLGLIDKDEYRAKVAELDNGPGPSKRPRQSSPDWDICD